MYRKTEQSLGSFTELPPGIRSKTKAILNTKTIKFNCLRLCITAALYLVTAEATRENKYTNNLVEDRNDYKKFV